MTEAFAALPRGRVLQYHNVTPARFFATYDPALFRLAALGRQELATLVGHVDLALGDSDFNRRELEALGFAPHRRPADRASTLTRSRRRRPQPGAREDPRRRPRQLPVRRPHRAEQEDRGHHPAGRALQALRRRLLPVHLRRTVRRRAAVLRDDPRADGASSRCCRSGSCSPAPCPTRSSRSYYRHAASTSR